MSWWDRITGRGGGDVVVGEVLEADPPGTALVLGQEVEVVASELRGAAQWLQESYTTQQLALEDVGWSKLTAEGGQAMTRQGLRTSTAVARVMARANPLIRRGLALRTAYVWGEGVNIVARAAGPTKDAPAQQDVNAVVQELIDDVLNVANWFGEEARERHEGATGTDGNVFAVLYTLPVSGAVNVRTLPWDEIEDTITNPEDRGEPWYYLRWFDAVDGDGKRTRQKVLYPHVHYRPATRFKSVAIRGEAVTVRWDAPVVPVHVNRQDGDRFGVGDVYTALAPARAYIDFVADWAQLTKALSRFAFRRSGGSTKSQKAAAAISAAAASAEAMSARLTDRKAGPMGDSRAGAMAEDGTLEAVPKTGATIDAESGRPLLALVAAALDVPITMLSGDPGVTGARATAETLDKPNELLMNARRRRWAEADRTIISYAIGESVRAPQGSLRGTIERSAYGREVIKLAGDTDPSIDITFPPIEKVDPVSRLQALKIADDIVGGKSVDVLRLVLEAVGVEDVDAALEDLLDEDGNIVDPAVNAGTAAVAAHLAGLDPASQVYGAPGGGGGGQSKPAKTEKLPAS